MKLGSNCFGEICTVQMALSLLSLILFILKKKPCTLSVKKKTNANKLDFILFSIHEGCASVIYMMVSGQPSYLIDLCYQKLHIAFYFMEISLERMRHCWYKQETLLEENCFYLVQSKFPWSSRTLIPEN